MAKNSAISTTRPEGSGTAATFATLRVSGDRLDPDAVTNILGLPATTAYRKGERYFAGPRSGYLLGRTGVWYLSTKGLLSDPDPMKHLSYLADLLRGEAKLAALQQLIRHDGLEVDASLFWHGAKGACEPKIPREIREAFAALPARLEQDFDKD